MKTQIISFLVLAITCVSAKGQSIDTNVSEFHFRFLDDVTGIKVIPEHVAIKQRESSGSNYDISRNLVANNGTAFIQVPNGTYDLTVSADGYESMSTYFEIKDQTLNVDFHLVPLSRPKELSLKHILSLHKPDAIVIVGCIVDDTTGMPLNGVVVFSADKIVRSTTDTNGFFQLILPLPASDSAIENRDAVFFTRDGYITEVRRKFDMWPNGDAILQMRMTRGHGVNKVDIVQNREPEIVVIKK